MRHRGPGLLVTPGIHSSTSDAYAALHRKVFPEVPPDMINKFQAVTWDIGIGMDQ